MAEAGDTHGVAHLFAVTQHNIFITVEVFLLGHDEHRLFARVDRGVQPFADVFTLGAMICAE